MLSHQGFGLEALDVADREAGLGRVQYASEWPLKRVGGDRAAQRRRLEQKREPGQCALAGRRRRKVRQRGPDMLLDIRRDCNAFMGDQRGYPLGGPGAFIGRIDVPKRLEGQLAAAFRRTAERRSEEHTSELQSLMRISFAVCRLTKQTQ